jgi:hypothetical protein
MMWAAVANRVWLAIPQPAERERVGDYEVRPRKDHRRVDLDVHIIFSETPPQAS